MCRFVDDAVYDKEAALFHLRCSAKCGILPAILTLAKIYAGTPHDLLSEVEVELVSLNLESLDLEDLYVELFNLEPLLLEP